MTRQTPALGRTFAAEDVRFLAPISQPRSFRDFSAFEMHTKNCVEGIGGAMNPLWYEIPVFYFSNPSCFIGHGDPVIPPRKAKSIDYELEVALVIGSPVRDLNADDENWTDHVAGFMLLNDWSARDLGAQETKLFMGPAKAKDFATSSGPWLTTPDEFDIVEGRLDLSLRGYVNGECWTDSNLNEMYFTWPRLLAHASADATLYPGDVVGSGTCPSGCIIELRFTKGRDRHGWLNAGDEVVLEAPKLGRLRNQLA
ncbi:fumarylacetoacetate hydrolase family protein [Sphingomonadales bacterium 56]|nr:fumarylacetoacetate hydrolase family protein [Sphingomonadales bacterium 56]MBY2958878.1 fumarylacetoacetate hydrolase family protein [Sphingomonadales bacterium 58]